jgi:hypothetical protein
VGFDVVLGIGLSGNGIDGLLQARGNTGREQAPAEVRSKPTAKLALIDSAATDVG